MVTYGAVGCEVTTVHILLHYRQHWWCRELIVQNKSVHERSIGLWSCSCHSQFDSVNNIRNLNTILAYKTCDSYYYIQLKGQNSLLSFHTEIHKTSIKWKYSPISNLCTVPNAATNCCTTSLVQEVGKFRICIRLLFLT